MATLAFILDRMDEAAPLSPFFERARWLLVFETESGVATWIPNRGSSGARLADRIVNAGAGAVVCGWIDGHSLARLGNAGVTVRLGPCTRPALSLAQSLAELPLARRNGTDARRQFRLTCINDARRLRVQHRTQTVTAPETAMDRAAAPLNRDEVVAVVGQIDDDKIAAIIGSGATLEELVEAFAWASDETDALADAEKSLSGTVAQVYDILTAEDWQEP